MDLSAMRFEASQKARRRNGQSRSTGPSSGWPIWVPGDAGRGRGQRRAGGVR